MANLFNERARIRNNIARGIVLLEEAAARMEACTADDCIDSEFIQQCRDAASNLRQARRATSLLLLKTP